ncbi:fructoselysine 6-kinase [Brevibacillus migulae]|uniref:fructoselysine 6-kinase n=1 Tax=Brevibacillus migulae TaxID=1644114 RepID=UPI00106E3BC4|nr:fructoselysine 6-kinase [Brevibacillus migulae]
MRVIGVGDNVVDKYVHKQMMYPGGNALNFSVYAKQLGVEAAYLGVFGNDQAADHIQQTLKTLDIDLSRCRQHEGENGYALVDLVDGDRVFVGGNHGGVQQQHPIVLAPQDLAYIGTFELAHSSIYSGMEEEIHKLREAGVQVSFDFSSDWNEEILQKLCPLVDYSLLSCGHLPDEGVKDLLKQCFSYGSKLVLATMGARGAMVYDGQSYYQKAPQLVKAVDTLGAGDSFFTAFILHYLQNGQNPLSALEAGTRFAAQTCLVEGAFGFGVAYSA